jgi:hypothetical protein
MTRLAVCLLALIAVAAEPDAKAPKKAPPPAKVAVTAELACLHCTFGEGESCAVCLKLDDKTPLVLEGKVAKQFMEDRLSRKVVVIDGTLTIKDKRLVLTSDAGHLYTDKDKGKAPEKGQLRVSGLACCGSCDLNVCDSCTLAVQNGKGAVILDGKLAVQHGAHASEEKKVTVIGKPYIDKRGLLRLDAQKVEFEKGKK